MPYGKSRTSIGSILFLGVLFALLWLLIAPIQLGGRVAYIVVSGNSMEPVFQFGDLIIAQEQSDYQVGEAVVYRHPGGGYVFHRIVEKKGDLFTFQGDNNSWVDSQQLNKNDILGKLWIHIPFGGKFINVVRTPRNLTVLAIVVMLSFFGSSKTKQNRKMKSRQHSKAQKENPDPKASVSSHFEGIIILGAITFAAIILGLFAFTRPVEKVETDNIQYQHIGVLLYHAADAQDLYDTDVVKTGEPVFLQLTCDLEIYYGYQLDSSAMIAPVAEQFVGSYRVMAQISDPNGWNRSLELAPLTVFKGINFTSGMHLDLCQVSALIAELEEKTGSKNNWYTLTIIPEVFIAGNIAGRSLEDNFVNQINFEVNKFIMRLPREFDETPTESLTPIAAGILPGLRVKLNTINMFGLILPVISARIIAEIILVSSLLGIVWLGWPLYQEWKGGTASRIRVQYEPMLIDVQPGSISPNGHAVPVDSFEDLAKLAERYGAMILCETNGDLNKYWVQDNEVMYEYALDTTEKNGAMMGTESLSQAILDAVALDEFQLYYQPIISTVDNTIEAFEALLRWFHPEKGVMYPAEFIAQAEEQGTMALIDNWVIEEACKRLKIWRDDDIHPVVISVNVSPYRFLDKDFIKWFSKTVKRCSCDARYLQLEINRANQIMDEELAIQNLHKLKQMGVLLAIDNFAASNSNQVDSITRLPVSSLKIDRKLLHRILLNPEDSRLVGAVVKMAKDLGLHVVAEGVETQEQLDFLGQQQIDAAQGYFTGRPMTVEDVTQLLIEDMLMPHGTTKGE